MRFVLFFALALNSPAWSAESGACSETVTNAVRAKLGEFILRVPDSPQNRWMVAKDGESWRITEYTGVRVAVRCQPASTAGEVVFQFATSRTTAFPKRAAQRLEWSQWSNQPAPEQIPFREHEGKVQLEWEYDEASKSPALMPALDINRFFSSAAKITRHTRTDYYPPDSIRRNETGKAVVESCVGPTGKLLRDPKVIESSGFSGLDQAAIKVAKANQYAAGTENGAALPESCIAFEVSFLMR
jgi:TonB family protein